jgi:hypothetical protein
MEEYDKLQQTGFAELKATVSLNDVSPNEARYEYRAHLNGFDLQFFSRGVKGKKTNKQQTKQRNKERNMNNIFLSLLFVSFAFSDNKKEVTSFI